MPRVAYFSNVKRLWGGGKKQLFGSSCTAGKECCGAFFTTAVSSCQEQKWGIYQVLFLFLPYRSVSMALYMWFIDTAPRRGKSSWLPAADLLSAETPPFLCVWLPIAFLDAFSGPSLCCNSLEHAHIPSASLRLMDLSVGHPSNIIWMTDLWQCQISAQSSQSS